MDGNSVYCIVKNFSFDFYACHIDTFKEEDVQSMLNTHFETVDHNLGKIRVSTEERIPILGINEPKKMFKIQTKTINICNMAINHMETLNWSTYNTEPDPIMRFYAHYSIESWIRASEWTDVSHFYKKINQGRLIKNRNTIISVDAVSINSLKTSSNAMMAPLRVMAFDIECISENGKFPRAELANDQIIQIGIVACEIESNGTRSNKKSVLLSQKKTDKLYNDTDQNERTKSPLDESLFGFPSVECFENEYELLHRFRQYLDENDPDVITGYNINGFDLPYTIKRCASKTNEFSRTKSACYVFNGTVKRNFRETQRTSKTGRINYDMYEYISNNYKLRSYKLNDVAKHFLNMTKDDIHYTEIKPLFFGSSSDRAKLGRYCVQDAVLALKLFFHTNALVCSMQIASVCGMPVNNVIEYGQQKRIRALLNKELQKTKYVIKKTLHNTFLPPSSSSSVNFEGALVLEPKVGLHMGPVAVCDFKSLYPSIMIANNICYSTCINPSGREENDRNSSFNKQTKTEEAILKNNDFITTPTGAKFAKASVRKGVLPKILENLLQNREEVRLKMSKLTQDDFRWTVLNGLQMAYKIVANALYGFTGAFQNGSIPCLEISSSVTAIGRCQLKSLVNFTQNYLNNTECVLYGDTDSIMVCLEGKSIQETITLIKSMCTDYSKTLPRPMSLEFENVLSPLLLLKKKKYIAAKVMGFDKRVLHMRGIETVRRDNCKLVEQIMLWIIDKIFITTDTQKAIPEVSSYLIDVVSKLKLNQFPTKDFAISKCYRCRDLKSTQPHVELVKRIEKIDIAMVPAIGDRVEYIITHPKYILDAESSSSSNKKTLTSKCAVLIRESEENNWPPDMDYYLYKQIYPPVKRICEFLPNIDVDKIFGINKKRCKLLGPGKRRNLSSLNKKTSSDPKQPRITAFFKLATN